MQRTQRLRQAFIAQKGFSTPSKDAMEKKVEEIVTEKAVELVESKREEILEKVAEQLEEKKEEIEKKVDEVADKAEDTVEKAAEEVGKKLEEAAKPLTDLIDKLDDNPQIAAVLEGIVTQVDGREISCSCFGWMFALRIHRKSTGSPPAKSEEIQKVDIASPSQSSEAKESVPPTVPPSA
jgi:hypothetical protein